MKKNGLKIIITGSEGLLGKEISKFLEKENKIIRVDLVLGHNLNDEKFVKQFFKKNDIAFKETISVNGNILSKLICLIYVLDYASIYKAVLSNTDPTPVKSIDYIKNRL